MQIKELKVIEATAPIGVGSVPYFSWKLTSSENNVLQASYHLRIVDNNGVTCMDSGVQNSEKSVYIPYTGTALRSRQRYHVKLTVKANNMEEAEAETTFETGLLKEEDWSACWAAVPKPGKHKPGFGNQQSSVYMRDSLTVKKKVSSARIYATAHGVYELFVNGRRPDQRFFAPEHTTYEKYLCYQTYDVTELLKEGDNVIGFHLGNGWYHSFAAKPNYRTDRRLAILYQLEIQYEDGTKEISGSSADTEYRPGPAIADLWAGEKYDARQELKNWTDEQDWKKVKVMKYGYGNLKAQNSDRITAIKELSVKKILRSPKGECILDFGQNIAGIVRISTNLNAGQEIKLEHCEVLSRDGDYYNNILHTTGVAKGIDQTDAYISDGTPAVYQPHFTYHGFRYVRLTIDGKSPTDVDPKAFTALVLSTEKENLASFNTSNEDLNRLYLNIRWSQYANMLSIPTDCPQREKAGWTGDMLVYAKTALLNENCTLLFSRWLENMYLEQDSYGIIPMVVPEDGSYPATGRLMNLSSGAKGKATSSGWGDAAVLVPLSMYEITGNTEVLKKQYYCMRRWCDYIIDQAANKKPKNCTRPQEIEQYLWDTGFHYGEWLIPSQNKEGMDMKNMGKIMKESASYTAPLFGWLSVKSFADIIDILHEEDPANALYATDQGKYRALAQKMKQAFLQGVIQEDGSMPAELMGAYVLPIFFDLVPNELKESFANHLVSILEKNNGCMDTGFLATPYLLDALCKINRPDLAYAVLMQDKAPSWISEIRHDATTIWENCFGFDEDGNPCNLSFNHYAFGCVADWIYRNVNGIIAEEAGFKSILICPKPDGKLTYAKRSYESVYGTIRTEWHIEGDHFYLEAEIPCNTRARVVMPSGKEYPIGSGVYHYDEVFV